MKHSTLNEGHPRSSDQNMGVKFFKQGFTLVEVLVASSILMLLFSGAVSVLIHTSRVTERARVQSTASTLTWSRVERVRNTDFDRMENLNEPAPGIRISSTGVPDMEGQYLRVTEVLSNTHGLPMKHIRVSVWPWDRQKRAFSEEPETIETIITDIPHTTL